jgi:uncharacterized protein (DUF4415 family)
VSKKSIKSDLKRLDAMRDEDIDYSDIPELDDSFFKRATVNIPSHKTQLTIRLDDDVLEWLKSKGRGYQTRMNAMLRTMMEHDKHPHQ